MVFSKVGARNQQLYLKNSFLREYFLVNACVVKIMAMIIRIIEKRIVYVNGQIRHSNIKRDLKPK